MISQFLVTLALTAFALGYVSLLLFLRLDSLRVARKRIWWIIGEVWGVFALVLLIFSLVSRRLGAVAQSSVAGELVQRFSRLHTLPALQQGLVIASMAAALGLFVHLIWSLQRAQRDADRIAYSSSDRGVQ